MKKLLTLGLVCLMSASFASEKKAPARVSNKANYPEFTWDHLNVCLHFSKSQDNFTQDEIAFISKFPLICLEKTQGRDVNGGADIGTGVAATAIKKANPKTKVLSYWNLKLDYGDLYSFGTMLGDKGKHQDWRLTNLKGQVQGTKTRFNYDVSNPELRKWWSEKAVEFSRLPGVDGIFVDALSACMNFPDRQVKNYGAEKFKAIEDGFEEIMQDIEKNFDDRLVIANGGAIIKGRDAEFGLNNVSRIDGAMTEHFCDLSGKSKDNIVAAIELIRQVALRERIFVVKGWPRYNFTNAEIRDKKRFTADELAAMAREDITFPLACFLCGAGKYSYFCYSWGYREDQGALLDFPEYHKPIGKPKGDYKKKGYIFTREFENLSVWVDVENRKAKLDWK